MKCPLLTAACYTSPRVVERKHTNCLKEECTWYQGDDKVCWIVQIGLALSSIAGDLIRIHHELCLSKYTYRCHECGVTIEKTAAGEFKWPASWTWQEQVDGKHVWICDRCSGPDKERR